MGRRPEAACAAGVGAPVGAGNVRAFISFSFAWVGGQRRLVMFTWLTELLVTGVRPEAAWGVMFRYATLPLQCLLRNREQQDLVGLHHVEAMAPGEELDGGIDVLFGFREGFRFANGASLGFYPHHAGVGGGEERGTDRALTLQGAEPAIISISGPVGSDDGAVAHDQVAGVQRVAALLRL